VCAGTSTSLNSRTLEHVGRTGVKLVRARVIHGSDAGIDEHLRPWMHGCGDVEGGVANRWATLRARCEDAVILRVGWGRLR